MTLMALGLLPLVSLSDFAPTDWRAVDDAFQKAQPCEFVQGWRAEPEPKFEPARARLGWRNGSLWIYAVLKDRDIFNAATEPNQPTWKTGDVFEMFVRPVEQDAYFELHVTPENQTLQLRWTDSDAVSSGRNWRDFLVSQPLFRSWTLVEEGQWRILVELPRKNLEETAGTSQDWMFSLGRYDVTRGADGTKQEVLSSTSPHQKPRFHRQEEWSRLKAARTGQEAIKGRKEHS